MPRILVVDDDRATLDGLVALLEGAGHEVTGSAQFGEARRLLLASPPALLIVDVRLHEYNGLQLVVIGKTLSPSPAAIVTSGFQDSVLEQEARDLGAPFLLKPVNPTELLELVKQRLAESRA